MHRNSIIALCAAFCAVAIVAGWIVAGMSSSGGPVTAAGPTPAVAPTLSTGSGTGTGQGDTPTEPAPSPATPSATESAPAPTSPAEPASPEPAPALEPTLEPPTAAPVAGAAQPAFVEYTVRKGDLLYTIAVAHNVTMEEILAINEIPNPESLTVGQVLRIPRK